MSDCVSCYVPSDNNFCGLSGYSGFSGAGSNGSSGYSGFSGSGGGGALAYANLLNQIGLQTLFSYVSAMTSTYQVSLYINPLIFTHAPECYVTFQDENNVTQQLVASGRNGIASATYLIRAFAGSSILVQSSSTFGDTYDASANLTLLN